MTNSNPRILLVGGGSTGHLAPLVAVWREIEKSQPRATVFTIATDRTGDREFLEREDIPYVLIPYPWRSLNLPVALITGFLRGLKQIKAFAPTVLLSKGGLVSVPVCLAARLKGIPIVVHESDAVMGFGTSIVRHLATSVCLGIETGVPVAKATLTGNPVRPDILAGSRQRALDLTKLSGNKPILFVTGGSQGAEALNRAVSATLPDILPFMDVIHLTGKGKTAGKPQVGYWSAETSGGAMGDLYAAASFALIRGGAGSISECAATGVPAIIVPIEGLAQNHQVHNAERAAVGGGCLLLPQREIATRLSPLLKELAQDPGRLTTMKTAVQRLQKPDAAAQIAAIVLNVQNTH